MGEFFESIPAVRYEGPKSQNPFAFKFYNRDEVVAGKPMKEHLKFAMAWWHTLCAGGTDMFGSETMDKNFGAAPGTMEHARAKADAGFELMEKLGIEYFCFHDLDLAPEGATLQETQRRLDEIGDYILGKMEHYPVKCLWGTANLFGHPRYMNGAASCDSPEIFCYTAAQVKRTLDLTVKLGGSAYVFWGGREGYDTLLNTDMKLEQDNIARLFHMAVDYGRSIGFQGDFLIEPKPKEPMKHQYDFDAATAIGFLRQYGLEGDFKLNLEANHATLAGHTFQHELRTAAINGMLGSIDANEGDMLLGWDTDEFPCDGYAATLCMYEILKSGGLRGGLNFDAKTRRASNTPGDLFHGFILGMDTFALGLRKAAALIEDGRLDEFVQKRYAGYTEGIGKKIVSGQTDLRELAALAQGLEGFRPAPGEREYLEGILNQVLFSGE
ncbi:xylose isomerase [Harryflintia acetispora]|uniref:xylose isomerase n=1 Tax=Harryflintia acetispora TaxID=1849041 RepID=UPI001898CC7C